MKFLIKFNFIFYFIKFYKHQCKGEYYDFKIKNGEVKIELFPDVAPNHVNRIKELANTEKYDNVVFHRVIDGFMAQTGDVKFGNSGDSNFNLQKSWNGRI